MVSHDHIVVGIPVYNEHRYVQETLESLQRQSHADFRAVISDNASTDGTSDICAAFVRSDERFRYVRQERNLGSIANLEWLLKNSSSPFFQWLGGHDLLAPDFLQCQLEVLDNDPGISLAYSRTRWIDGDGHLLRESDGGDFIQDAPSGLERYISAAVGPWNECTAINGVLRRTAVEGARFLRHSGPDHLLLTRAQFFGRFHRTERPIYTRREYARREDYLQRIRGEDASGPGRNDFRPLILAQMEDFLGLDIDETTKLTRMNEMLEGMERRYRTRI
jgi:glycosyltransferase involved in cell wall biosynthesis